QDHEHFDLNGATGDIEFRPQPVPDSQSSYGLSASIAVERLDGFIRRTAGKLLVRGDCKSVTYYIDEGAFRETMVRMAYLKTELMPGDPPPLTVRYADRHQLLENTSLSNQVIAAAQAFLRSPSVQSSLLSLMSANLRDYLAPLNQNSLYVAQVFDRANADIVIDVFHSQLTRLTCVELEHIFALHGVFAECNPAQFTEPYVLGLPLGLPFVPAENFPGAWFLQADHRQPPSSAPGDPGT